MARSLLIKGMLAGVAAGLAAFVVAYVFGEVAVDQAIAVEAAAAVPVADAGGAPEAVGREAQSTIGLLAATLMYGVAVGGLFSLVFAALQGRVGAIRSRLLALLLGLGGFVLIAVVPFVKYPPNPPAVGYPETIGRRTTLYLAMLGISVLLGVLAVVVARQLAPTIGGWNAAIAAGVGFVLVIGVTEWLMPSVGEVSRDFPATTLYLFRLSSIGVQLTVWITLGLVFGALVERSLRPGSLPVRATEPAPAGS